MKHQIRKKFLIYIILKIFKEQQKFVNPLMEKKMRIIEKKISKQQNISLILL